MPKRTIDVASLGVPATTIKGMVRARGNMIGDEVYFSTVLQIESSEPVLKALDNVLDGVKNKSGAKTTKA